MSFVQERIQNYKKYQEDRLSGIYDYIPNFFDRWNDRFPAIPFGANFTITANSGVGKSSLATFILLNIIKQSKELNIKVKIFYFFLEQNKEVFWDKVISNLLYTKYKVVVSLMQLRSIGKPLDSSILEKINSIEEDLIELESYVEVVSHIYNPTGLFKEVRKHARENGTFYLNNQQIDINKTEGLFDKYTPNTNSPFVFVFVDNVDLLEPENGMNHRDSIRKWTRDYCEKNLCKYYNYTVFNLHQQNAQSESQTYTMSGKLLAEKMTPSLDGLSINKETARDCDFVWGLFAPYRSQGLISEFRGYNINVLKNQIRFLISLKDRHFGTEADYVPLFFQGENSYFKVLPPADKIDYKKLTKIK